jgi:phosphopantetheinyl transferase (holo-ACP synthase)
MGLGELAVSLSHSEEFAVAFVVAESVTGNHLPLDNE